MRRYPFLIALFWMIFSLGHSQMVVIPTLTLQVVCDLTITASMVYYLYIRRSKVRQCVKSSRVMCGHAVRMTTVLRRTIDAITTLALYTITTGALALFVTPDRPSPARRPNSFSAYSRFYHSPLSVSVSTVILISTFF